MSGRQEGQPEEHRPVALNIKNQGVSTRASQSPDRLLQSPARQPVATDKKKHGGTKLKANLTHRSKIKEQEHLWRIAG